MGFGCDREKDAASRRGWSLGCGAAWPGLRFLTRDAFSRNLDHCPEPQPQQCSRPEFPKNEGIVGPGQTTGLKTAWLGGMGLAPSAHSPQSSA